MKMQESPEDYLEAILVLSRELGNVRSIDVANYLEYSKPSVSVAMKRLRENGFVTLDEHGNLILTGSGLSIALKIYERHLVISQFLISIGVDEAIAKKDACRKAGGIPRLPAGAFACLRYPSNICMISSATSREVTR